MEKSKLIKIVLVGLIALTLVFNITSTVFADDGLIVLDPNSGTASNSAGNTQNNTSDNTNTNANTNTNTNTNANTNTNTNTSITTLNTNTNSTSSSSYNNNSNKNTNLPKTGIAETSSVLCVIFALAISAVYAFKKLKEYNV